MLCKWKVYFTLEQKCTNHIVNMCYIPLSLPVLSLKDVRSANYVDARFHYRKHYAVNMDILSYHFLNSSQYNLYIIFHLETMVVSCDI